MIEHQHPVAERAADAGGDGLELPGPAVVVRHHLDGAGLPADPGLRDLVEVGELVGTPEGVSGH